ncbi:MAG: nucleotidyltransferase domain-containing protein [Rhodoferax sp.]|uniref:nucleotidyltransferase domain-containing protein n=1 Tax=Rhodoferax sp. TaxID=50421 RepID=UPI002ACE9802|nr:nucleotidyltransferase domain-containing protein [Rhodoferax sp.]MDZ7891004.1 nucleotidyltransferase domain-containing protein [Rhodoferax sp.]
MLEFGLPRATCSIIRRILAVVPEVDKAVVYGSRAKGSQSLGSDIDLTLFGQDLTLTTLRHIAAQLDESTIPYPVNLSVFDRIVHPVLREHIERVVQVFYFVVRR